jgi:hypothetical protein
VSGNRGGFAYISSISKVHAFMLRIEQSIAGKGCGGLAFVTGGSYLTLLSSFADRIQAHGRGGGIFANDGSTVTMETTNISNVMLHSNEDGEGSVYGEGASFIWERMCT